MAATSCNSATLSTLWPEVVPIRLRSASAPRPIAVDDSASPSAATSATRQSSPAAPVAAAAIRAMPTISAVEPNSWALPQPKIGLRKAQSRRGSSSRPTRNSISTTPNSAKCSMSCGSVTSFRPQGPIAMPAAR